MVKISDIAEKADVSITAVSLALNNKPGVGEKTKNRILQIADELNYIKTGKSSKNGSVRLMRIINHGHTINSDHDNFLSHYIENITEASRAFSCDVQVVSCNISEAEQKIKSFNTENVIGIIIIGTELEKGDIINFRKNQLPIVFIDTYYPSINFDFVNMNNYSAVNDIIEYLMENNHVSIGMVSSHINTENFRQREKAFTNITSETENVEICEFTVDSTFDGAFNDFNEIIKANRKLPSALFCVNDIVALGCIKALNNHGIRIPEDISLVGFDNIPQSRMTVPALTSIQVDHKKMSEFAVRLLFDRIESAAPQSPIKVSVGTSLIIRDSVRNRKE